MRSRAWPRRSAAACSRAHERRREVTGIEWPKIVESLADADQLHRHAELVSDCDGNPSLRRTVELRERDARHLDGLTEEPCLLQAVLAGGRVDHEERLVRRVLEPS